MDRDFYEILLKYVEKMREFMPVQPTTKMFGDPSGQMLSTAKVGQTVQHISMKVRAG